MTILLHDIIDQRRRPGEAIWSDDVEVYAIDKDHQLLSIVAVSVAPDDSLILHLGEPE